MSRKKKDTEKQESHIKGYWSTSKASSVYRYSDQHSLTSCAGLQHLSWTRSSAVCSFTWLLSDILNSFLVFLSWWQSLSLQHSHSFCNSVEVINILLSETFMYWCMWNCCCCAMQQKYLEWSYQMPRSQYGSLRLSEKRVCELYWVCVYAHVTSAINHKPQCPCSSNTYHGNQCRGQVEQSYPTPENTTAANKYGRLIHTSTTRLSNPIDLLQIMCVRTWVNAYMYRNTNVTECLTTPHARFDLVTLWDLEMNYLSLREPLHTIWEDKSRNILYFSYCLQILWKDQNQKLPEQVLSLELKPDTVYLVGTPSLWSL